MKTATDCFAADLRFSDTSGLPWVEALYRSTFPGFDERIDIRAKDLQRQGVDYLVLADGGPYFVEEKVRRVTRPDILLELKSTTDKGTEGWWNKPNQGAQFLAYLFADTQTGLFVDMKRLRGLYLEREQEWLSLAKQGREGFGFFVRREGRGSTFMTVPLTKLQEVICQQH